MISEQYSWSEIFTYGESRGGVLAHVTIWG